MRQMRKSLPGSGDFHERKETGDRRIYLSGLWRLRQKLSGKSRSSGAKIHAGYYTCKQYTQICPAGD